MPKIAANVTMLYTELAEERRYGAAAADGFTGVEILFPYVHAKETIRGWLDETGMAQVLINMPAGDWANGERGLACLPDRKGEFQDAIGQAIDYARHLGCPSGVCVTDAGEPGNALALELRELLGVEGAHVPGADHGDARQSALRDPARERSRATRSSFGLRLTARRAFGAACGRRT